MWSIDRNNFCYNFLVKETVQPNSKERTQEKPLIGVIMGSDSDMRVMRGAIDVLKELEIPHSVNIISAHRTPEEMIEYAKTAKERGLQAIIAGAGGAAHLPSMTAALTLVPVIGIPIAGEKLEGIDSLLSQVQMPSGVPVGVMAIDGAKNAALYAAAWLANTDPVLYARLETYRQTMHDGVIEKNTHLQKNI